VASLWATCELTMWFTILRHPEQGDSKKKAWREHARTSSASPDQRLSNNPRSPTTDSGQTSSRPSGPSSWPCKCSQRKPYRTKGLQDESTEHEAQNSTARLPGAAALQGRGGNLRSSCLSLAPSASSLAGETRCMQLHTQKQIHGILSHRKQ